MFELFIASIAALLLLYIPGFALFKALRCSNLVALIAAPLASCAAYGLLPIVYYEVGIPCDLLTVVMIPTFAFALAFAASCIHAKKGVVHTLGLPLATGEWRKSGNHHETAYDWAVLCLYLVCGIVICSYMFIGSLGSAEAFFSRFDNQTHLNVAQAFIDSGQWSSLHAGRYLASLPNQAPHGTPSAFYPATWHGLVAMICLLVSTKVTIASNALVAVCAAVVFPAGMYLIMRSLFPNHRAVVVAGAFVAVSFSTYPWFFPIKGPTLPQMLAFAIMVGFIGLLIAWLEQGKVRQKLLSFVVFAFISFIALAIAHTNALFTAFVFLAAYGGHYLWRAIGNASSIPPERITRTRILALLVYLAAIIAFWAFCLTTPVLHGVVGYDHYENYTVLRAMAGLVTMRFGISAVQIALCIVSLVGIIVCIKKRIFWILIPVAYMAIAYFLTRTSYQPWMTIFAGLWYSLPYRAAECLCIFLMPVASVGLVRTLQGASNITARIFKNSPSISSKPQIGAVVVAVLLAAMTYPTVSFDVAGHRFHTPFASVAYTLTDIYAQDGNRVYGAEEVAFVDKAMEMIPENALVINSPNDGSLFAYGVNHMNTYFRGSAVKHQSETAITLRAHLNEYRMNPEVAKAIEETDAQYVLQLDHGVSYEDLIKLPQFYEKNRDKWRGVDRIDENTLGFTLLLSEGDMRLYRIDR